MANIGMIALGCDKNRVDAELMLGLLAERGHTLVRDPAEADALIVHTCGFIESAKKESIGAILEMAKFKEGRCRALAVTGCLAQRYFESLRQEIPEIDVLLGVGALWSVADALDRALGGERVFDPSGRYLYPENAGRMRTTAPHTAFLKIADGCNNRCAYCAIPLIRGPYQSRPMDGVVREAQGLVAAGVREMVLVAQDVTAYGSDREDGAALVPLLQKLSAIEGDFRIRLLYLYPERITDGLLGCMASESKVCKYLDIPLQHTETAVLRSMRRRADRGSIEALYAKIRAYGVFCLRTTVIAGFPGETREQFEAMKAFFKEHPFDRLGVFAYSQEEGTPAAERDDQVPPRARESRRQALMRQQQGVSGRLGSARVGTVCRVLIEGSVQKGIWAGRSEWEAPEVDGKVLVRARGDAPVGQFCRVRIVEAQQYDLIAVPEEEVP